MNQQRQRNEFVPSDTSPRRNLAKHPSLRRIAYYARLVTTIMLCCGLTSIAADRANAQLDIFDDFEVFQDRAYQHRMPLKAEWTINSREGLGAEIKNGDLLRVPVGAEVSYLEFAESKLTDVSIRTQARMLTELAEAGEPDADDGLWHSISLAARLCGDLGNHCRRDPAEFTYIDLWSTGEVRAQQNAAADQRIVHTHLRPLEEDVVLQLDAFGTDIKFWVWRHGEPRPEEPVIQYTEDDDPTTDEGGVLFGTLYSHAAFRNVHISDTPIEDTLGDFDFDSQIEAADMDLLSAEILSESPRPWFDLNGDDKVTVADRDVWVGSENIANTFLGDADLSGEVDITDFLALSERFGQEGGWAEGDFDGSSVVDFGDFLLLSGNFGNAREATPAQSVPEPSAPFQPLACCLCLLGKRRRRGVL